MESFKFYNSPSDFTFPFDFQDTVEAEVVRIEPDNIYLYGKVEFKKRESVTHKVVRRSELIVARAIFTKALPVTSTHLDPLSLDGLDIRRMSD